MQEYHHQHLKIPSRRRSLRFKGNGRGKFTRRPLSREEHAARLRRQLDAVRTRFEEERERFSVTDYPDEFSLVLNIKSAPGYTLKFDSLERKPSKYKDGIYLLNLRYEQTNDGEVMCASILVPFGQLEYLGNKIAAYANPEKDSVNERRNTRTPKNADLLANIQSIGVAALEALWTEPEPLPDTDDALWWEMWVSRATRARSAQRTWIQSFEATRNTLGLEINRFRLRLPDNEIVLVKARRSVLEGSLELLNTLTEIRKVRPCSVDLSDLPPPEQNEWIDEALGRIDWPPEEAPAVCLIDTGVNREHPLLERLLSEDDLQTILAHIGAADHPNPRNAHGTPMAGIAAYDDLRDLMMETGPWPQRHRLESVKLIHEGNEHDPEHYGPITQEAIARPEAQVRNRLRIYCLALSQSDFPAQGQPSSWSAAIDSSIAGTEEEGRPRRVLCVSAGNHRNFLNYNYPVSNRSSCVENPAQAWNAITVGAMTRRTAITEADDESRRSRAVAGFEELSPFSRTSSEWNDHWPIKPEIVCEGGNLAQTESGEFIERNSLEPISTASNFLTSPLCNMNATSAATASASRLGAMLMAAYPDYWPETYRGLLVHSASWSSRMLGAIDPHRPGNVGAVQSLLRTCGFGEPDPSRLLGSGESGVTMIIQDVIHPYDPDSKAGEAKLGNFNLHTLPWPKLVFERNPDIELQLKITLSYYIDPNPGSRSWSRSKKYRYSSHLLRFSFKRAEESEETFQRALEKQVEQEEVRSDSDDSERRAPADAKWALGPKLRGKAGSLVQDLWKGSPAELAEMDQVAVFPAKGWFATRSFPADHEFHDCHRFEVRYSLIISIDAAQEIGLYTAVSNAISIEA